MRKLLLLFLLLPLAAVAQSTTVSTSGVVDTDGFTWKAGSYQISFVPNPLIPSINSYVWSGGNLQQNALFKGTLDSSGAFSVSIPDSTTITPAGSQWLFSICPNATTGCFVVQTPVAGSTANLTTLINSFAIGPRFIAAPSMYGYGTVEVSTQPKPGFIFFNTTSSTCSQWTTTSWQTCTGGGGGGTIGGSGTTGYLPAFTAPTTIGNSHLDDGVTNAGQVTTSEPFNYSQCSVAQTSLLNLEGSLTRYPECYGAQGNGSFDDEPAFAAALAACPSSTNCTIKVSSKNYVFGEQLTISGIGRSLVGDGFGATQISCSPGSSQNACIEALNTPLFLISGIRLTCNSNVTYCLEHKLTGSSAENQTVSNMYIQGGSYGWAISPDNHGDISHINGYGLNVGGTTTADAVIGDGVQSNVLDNNCYGCTFDTSSGDGVQIRGGGFSIWGGAFDENAGIDVNLLGPPSQPVIVSGVRSEGSAQFFRNNQGGGFGIPGILLDNDYWSSGNSPNTCNPVGVAPGPCAISVNSSIPITINGGRYSSAAGNVEMNFSAPGSIHPISVLMENVATSNPNFGATLQSLVRTTSVVLTSINDIYVDSTDATHPGSGINFQGNSSYVLNNLQLGNNLNVGGFMTSAIAGFGPYANYAKHSLFDTGTTDWPSFATPPLAPITTNQGTDVFGNTTAEEISVSPSFQNYSQHQDTGQSMASGTTWQFSLYAYESVAGDFLTLALDQLGAHPECRPSGGTFAASYKMTTTNTLYTGTCTTASTFNANPTIAIVPGANTTFNVFISQAQVCEVAPVNNCGPQVVTTTTALSGQGAVINGTVFNTSSTANLVGGVLGSVPYQSAPGTTAFTSPNTSASTLCYTETGTGSVGAAPVWGACSGSAATAFSAITGATNTSAAMVVGSGASIAPTGTGTIAATSVGGITVTGTPSVGNVLTASSSSAAGWAAPSSSAISGLTTGQIPIAGSATTLTSSVPAPSGTVVGTTDTQTLTNKTLDGVSPATMVFVDPTSSIQTQLNGKQATLTLPLSVANGGSGANTLTGYVKGNGTSPYTASVTIPGSAISGNITGTASNLTAAAALPNGTTATTQAPNDNSTKLATTAYVKAPGDITPTSVTVTGSGPAALTLPPVTYSTLNSAYPCAFNAGLIASVSDSTTQVWGAAISGGGSFYVLAVCDGGSYTVIGK